MRPADQAALLTGMELLYECVHEPERWLDFLALIGTTLGLDLLMVEHHGVGYEVPQSVGLDPSDRTKLEQYYWSVNPYLPQLLNAQAGEVRAASWVVPQADLYRSEYFNDFGRHIGQHDGVAGVAFAQDTQRVSLSAIRGKSRRLCGEREVNLFKALVPHIANVCRIRQTLWESQARADASLEALSRLHQAVVLLGARGRLVSINCAAVRMAAQNDGLCITESRGIRGNTPGETAQLTALIRDCIAAASGQGRGSGGNVLITRPSGKRPWLASVAPFKGAGGQPLATVVISDPEQRTEPSASTIAKLLGFTPMETRVGLILAQGISPEDAAGRLGITVNTARTHVRHMLSKAGLNRYVELVVLLNRIPPSS